MNSVSQIDGLKQGSAGGGGLGKGTMALASTSVWKKAAPPPPNLIPDDSVLPCMSPLPLEMLPQCWN